METNDVRPAAPECSGPACKPCSFVGRCPPCLFVWGAFAVCALVSWLMQ